MAEDRSSLRPSASQPASAQSRTLEGAGSAAAPSHTPGPWEYVPSTEHHGAYVTTAADGTYGDIADCYCMSNPSALSVRNGGSSFPVHHQRDRADANARLIAAAPDLLAAAMLLEEAEDFNANDCEECGGDGVPELCPACFPKFDDARIARRNAIAKAGR